MRCNFTSLLLFSIGASAAAVGKKVPKGFVSREGEAFKLDGKDFYFAGSNAYYFPFNDLPADVEAGLGAAKKAGLNVMRTWGFNDRNKTSSTAGLPKYGGEGAGPSPNVMQLWDNGKS